MPIKGEEKFIFDVKDFCVRQPPELALTAARKIAFEAFNGVVQMCPVKTGRARGSVQISLQGGDYPDGEPDFAPYGSMPGVGQQADALGVLKQAEPFQPIWVGTNLVYMPPLEHGHSKQAPVGMFAVTMTKLQAKYGGGQP